MKAIRGFFAFLYDFLVGDDVLLFAIVAAGLGATALIGTGTNAWWLLPLVVAAALALSVWRAARR